MRAIAALALVAAACVEELPPLDETTSLAVTISGIRPSSPDDRLTAAERTLTVTVTAKNAQNQLDTRLSRDVQVYVQFLGTLTPELSAAAPFASIPMTSGVSAPTAITLPAVFGPTRLWIEDGGDGGTFATGTSDELWYADPYVADISTPRDFGAIDALSASPLQNKQVTVRGSRYGARGRLVVNGTYAQGYSVSDVQCADEQGTPPCVAGDFDHVLVFSFSRPKDEMGRNINPGQFIDGFAGSVQEFNGLTEMGFPQSFATDTSADLARIPEPAVVQGSWFVSPIEFEKHESGLIAVEGATVCPLDSDFTTFKQWKLDLGRGCGSGSAVNVITAGVIDFDAGARVGTVLARVVGVLRPVNTTRNVFIMYPRDAGDLTP